MSALSVKKAANHGFSERDLLTSKYHRSRHNLLLVVICTAINLVLLLTNSGTYYLFSAYVPYLLGDLAMDLCGKYSPEYYAEVYGADMAEFEFYDNSFFIVAVAIAAIIIGVYLLCWFLAKKPRVGFMVFGLVLFVIDTAVMLFIFGINLEMILDIVFHAWVIIALINGISAYYKLKKLPAEEVVVEAEAAPEAQTAATLNGESIE